MAAGEDVIQMSAGDSTDENLEHVEELLDNLCGAMAELQIDLDDATKKQMIFEQQATEHLKV